MSPLGASGVPALVGRVARRLGRALLLAAGLWAAVALASILLLAWLLAGPEGWRQGSWGPLLVDVVLLTLAGVGAYLFVRIRRVWLAEARVARCVEDAAGLRAGTVLGSLELSRGLPPGVSGGLARFAEQTLAGRLAPIEARLDEPMRRRVLVWTRGALASLALFAPALILATALSPSRSMSAWGALSSPVARLRVPALPPLEVLPGDADVRRGEPARVDVRAPRREAVTFHWQPAGEVARASSLPVDAVGAAAFDFPAVTVPVRYWVEAPDGARSAEFHLTPVDPLFVSDLRLVLEFPAHTARVPEEHAGDVPALTVPEGTRIRIDGRASRPLREAALVPEDGGTAEPLVLDEASGFSAVWRPTRSGTWTWHFLDQTGAPAALAPRPLELTLEADRAPTVRFDFPAADGPLPLTMRQPLVLEVEDDYGVAALELVAYRVSAGERGEDVVLPVEVGGARGAIARPVLDVGDWGLLPGDEVRYLARVTDNSPAGQTATTQEWVLRMPGASEMRRGAQETLDEATQRIEELADEVQRAAQETRDLARAAAVDQAAAQRGGAGAQAAQEGGFQRMEDLRRSLERQDGIASELDAMRQELESLSDAMREAGVSDPGLRDDLEELQRLLEEMGTGEDADRLREMLDGMDELQARQAQQSLEDLARSQEEMREMLENSLERFQRAAVEQDFRATASEADELARLERALAEALREGQDPELRAQQQADLERRAEDVDSAMQRLEERLRQLGEEPAASGVQEGRERAAEARQAMSQAEQQARQGQTQQAGQQADQAAASMQRAAEDLREARQGMSDQRTEQLQQALQGAADEALALARRQAEIRQQMENADGEALANLRGDLSAVLQGVQSMGENLADAMRQAGGGDSAIGEGAQEAAQALERAIEASGPRPTPGPSAEASAEAAIDALNRTAMAAYSGAAQMAQQQGQSQGQEQQGDVEQQLEGLAQQQGQVNSQTGEIVPMQLGEQALQNQLRELAEGQRQVAGDLQQLAQQPDAQERALGDLAALAQEAEALARMLEGGRLDPETRQRQEQLFHRLLDAGRSLEKEDEISEQREATTAGAVDAAEVLPLSAEVVGGVRFRLPPPEVLDRLGPAERQLVFEYFERLNREAPRPATDGSAGAAAQPASPPPAPPGDPR